MNDRNWAEHDKQIQDNPSLKQAYELGYSHAGYGWSAVPWGHWSDDLKSQYYRGHSDYGRLVNKEVKHENQNA